MNHPVRLLPRGRASQPKAGEPNFSPVSLLQAAGPGGRSGTSFYPLESRGFEGPRSRPASKQARRMIDRIDKGLVFKPLNNRPFLHGETEPCINGRILGIGAYFTEPNDALADQLLSEQLEDGGWNCEAPKSQRSSFHTTICVLEGLLEYERAGRKSTAVTKARKRAENYLLERRMFRSLRTGEVINKRWLRFSYPTFWHYDVLRGLDYLRDAGMKPDSRIDEAIDVAILRRHQNGRWPLNILHPEQIPLEMETEIGRASHWNTLRALRVLRWYNNSRVVGQKWSVE